jgi:hypothetical protein
MLAIMGDVLEGARVSLALHVLVGVGGEGENSIVGWVDPERKGPVAKFLHVLVDGPFV